LLVAMTTAVVAVVAAVAVAAAAAVADVLLRLAVAHQLELVFKVVVMLIQHLEKVNAIASDIITS